MEQFEIQEFFDAGHKNVEGIFILLSNSTEPGVREVLSNIKNDANLRAQFDEIIEKALPFEFVSLQNMMIDLTATTIYNYINQHHDVKVLINSESFAFLPINEFGDYNRNMQKIFTEFEHYKKFAGGMKQRQGGLISMFCNELDKFQDLIGEIIKFNVIAQKGKKYCFAENLRFDIFSESTIANNKKLIAQLMSCKGKLEKFEYMHKDYAEQGVGVFSSLVDEWSIFNEHMVRTAKKDKEFRDNVHSEIEKARIEKERIEPTISPAEQERLNMIKKANDLYDQLCFDFIRDLQNQYALSSKDMYEYFINVKFKKFVETFNMPLSQNVSLGKAKEVCSQINNLMDYISKISENSYTTSVYPIEKQ